MKKIVLITDNGEKDQRLIELLRAFFPECDVSMVCEDKGVAQEHLEDSTSKGGQ